MNWSVRNMLPARLLLTRQVFSVAGLGATLIVLSGCQSITGSAVSSQIRVIDASPDAGGLDVYQGSGVLAYNLGQGTITSYIPTTPGTYTINVDLAGTKQQIAQQEGTFALNSQYTVLIGNYMAGIQETILKDQSVPAPSNQVAFRILDQSASAGALDLYLIPSGSTLTQVKPILSGVTFGQNSGYLNIPVGTYSIAAVPAGTIPASSTVTSYSGPAVTYPNRSARTIILLDQPVLTTPGIQVIVADDFDPATEV